MASIRTPRHTTHLKDLPEHVTITRPHHPFEGKTLPVFGLGRYRGKLHLTLILPNGSRSLIPVEWTDLNAAQQSLLVPLNTNLHFGSLSDLLHAVAVVDALLHRRALSHGSDAKLIDEENHSATPSKLSRHSHSRNPDMGNAGQRTQNTGDRSSGTADRPGNPCPSDTGAKT